MTRTVRAVDEQLTRVSWERHATRADIDRKLSEIDRKAGEVANLRATYAAQGKRLDGLLDERMDAAVTEAMHTPPSVPEGHPEAEPAAPRAGGWGTLLNRYAAGGALPVCTCGLLSVDDPANLEHAAPDCPTHTQRRTP